MSPWTLFGRHCSLALFHGCMADVIRHLSQPSGRYDNILLRSWPMEGRGETTPPVFLECYISRHQIRMDETAKMDDDSYE